MSEVQKRPKGSFSLRDVIKQQVVRLAEDQAAPSDPGMQVLKQFESQGLELPSSNALKGQGGKIKVKCHGGRHSNRSRISSLSDPPKRGEGYEDLKSTLGANLRKQVKEAHVAKIT